MNGERCTLFRGVWQTLNQKEKEKKRAVKSKTRGGGRGTIFRLLVTIPKINDGTNGERYKLFSDF